MFFIKSKFEVLWYDKDIRLKDQTLYESQNKNIEAKFIVKDLGLTINGDSKLIHHFLGIVKEVKILSSWILRILNQEV